MYIRIYITRTISFKCARATTTGLWKEYVHTYIHTYILVHTTQHNTIHMVMPNRIRRLFYTATYAKCQVPTCKVRVQWLLRSVEWNAARGRHSTVSSLLSSATHLPSSISLSHSKHNYHLNQVGYAAHIRVYEYGGSEMGQRTLVTVENHNCGAF